MYSLNDMIPPEYYPIIDGIFNIWMLFIIVVMLFTMGIRKQKGLWSTQQAWGLPPTAPQAVAPGGQQGYVYGHTAAPVYGGTAYQPYAQPNFAPGQQPQQMQPQMPVYSYGSPPPQQASPPYGAPEVHNGHQPHHEMKA